ncbi:THO complex subunit 6 [Liparis tanakae]|uniref:THO complex subunit 6 n=1 Tax=Liparis tanakae TaxID=230148 RepID=A0A4Z2IRD9_9TELE|nr:THO complex subunit 6 [Liparis tanakae]
MGPVELLHMSVFSQSFSPCGRFLAAGNNYGEIAVFSLSAALSPDATPLSQKPVLRFTGTCTSSYRYSLYWYLYDEDFPSQDNSLVFGGGDNNVHILDLEHGVFKSVLQGHTDYVHCVSVRDREAEILSGGEDGAGVQRQTSFYQDMILAVGEGPSVSHCLLGGEVKAQIPCSPQSLNTLQLNTSSTEHRVLTVGGSSDLIDVFTNLSYRTFSLSF